MSFLGYLRENPVLLMFFCYAQMNLTALGLPTHAKELKPQSNSLLTKPLAKSLEPPPQSFPKRRESKISSPRFGGFEGGIFNFGNRFTVQNRQLSQSICTSQLGAAIDAVISRPQLAKSRWGIVISPLAPNIKSNLYNRDGERFFIPASNAKLLTTAAALLQLGSTFRIRTSVYGTPTFLTVVGRGDPSLSKLQLKDLAQQLKRQGVRNVQHLIVDDGYFQGNSRNLTWQWEDVQSDYGTAVNSLILNQNAVELKLSPQKQGQPLAISWSDKIASSGWQIVNNSITASNWAQNTLEVTAVFGKPILKIQGQLAIDAEAETFGLPIIEPAAYFLEHFQQTLAAEGITVAKASIQFDSDVSNQQELAAVESSDLANLLVETNQESNNLYSEILLRTLSKSAQPTLNSPAINDSAELGLKHLKASLTKLGVNPESYVLFDGSGLSRQNLVTPQAIAQTLKLMAQTPQAAVYHASLPTAGVNGTLKRRFLNTPLQGNLQAKTGTLTGVAALSGYLDVPGYQPLVFSIMVNQSEQSTAILRQAIDEIVLLLTHLSAC
jgi:D-alanyl-D-alanine carboxypeptidase/D-alanyl-D-alanine-endopeptidase (penicillin-binding protein 4)